MAQLGNLIVTGTARFLNEIKGKLDWSNILNKPTTLTGYGITDALPSTTKYAGSSSVGGAATSANKLNTNAGSGTQPVYFNNGVPTATTYALNKTVPSDAVFTDTDTKVTQTEDNSSNGNYELLFSGTADNTTRTEGAKKSANALYNPSKKSASIGESNAVNGNYSFAFGYNNNIGEDYSFAEGLGHFIDNSSTGCHSEGYYTSISSSSLFSHTEGDHTVVSSGNCNHAEGCRTNSSGYYSHTQGYYTKSTHRSQHVFGEYNVEDPSINGRSSRGNYVEIVGNGDSNARSNARTLDWNGNEWIAGNLTDKWGLQTSRTMTQAQFDQLTQTEKDNGTTYYISDGVPLRICDYIYPIGAIYMSVNNISPAILFGGTWERIKDRFLLAAGDTYNAGSTGGEAEHTLGIGEMPRHRHRLFRQQWWGVDTVHSNSTSSIFNWRSGAGSGGTTSYSYRSNNEDVTTSSNDMEVTGNGQPHNNMPPYLTVYMWKRVPDPEENNEEQGE